MKKQQYNIYATLLDSFVYFQNSRDDNAFQDFINRINRVQKESLPAKRGTAFNMLIDAIILNKDIPILFRENEVAFEDFVFPAEIVTEFVETFRHAHLQKFCEGFLEIPEGSVRLYGFIDALQQDHIFDIKTTENYVFPKYLHGLQHLIYPYCLSQMGFVGCNTFVYKATDFSDIYTEEYIYQANRDIARLQAICSEMVHFLETNRHLITDTRIFSG